MAMPVRIALPPRLRIDGELEFDTPPAALSIVHVGQSALVFRRHETNTLVIITTDSAGLMPGRISLRMEDFRRVRDRVHALHKANESIVPDRWGAPSTSIESVNLALGTHTVSRHSVDALVHELRLLSRVETSRQAMSPEPIRAAARAFAASAVSGDLHDNELLAMVGAGPGTTPSGDDVIVGVLAGLHTLGLVNHATHLSSRLLPLLNRTTAASRHYINAAVENRFGEHVHQLVHALAAGVDHERTVRHAARWGATSGIDLLTGLVSVLANFHDSQTIESAA